MTFSEETILSYKDKAMKAYLPGELYDHYREVLKENEELKKLDSSQLARRMSDLERANQLLHVGYPVMANAFWVMKAQFEEVVCDYLADFVPEELKKKIRKRHALELKK